MKTKTIRFAVIGAGRGASFINIANAVPGVQLTAICDSNPAALESWKSNPDITTYSEFDQVLNDPKIDAVCIATPANMHGPQAVAALKAGKHVLSEVIAAYTLEEGWDLIRAVEKSGLTYMMAENDCYLPDILMVQNMVEQGVFGELIHATGSYLHDCRSLLFTPEGDLTWRGQFRKKPMGNSYPTHGLGPVCRWLGINRTDFLETTSTWQSRGGAAAHYAKRNFPNKPEYADPQFWKHPDTVTTMIRTTNGVLIESRLDWTSARPYHWSRYELQGIKASFTTASEGVSEDGRRNAPKPLIWIEDRSPQRPDGEARFWEPLSKYDDEFKHPLWREHEEEAQKTGHGGCDYFCLREFAQAIQQERTPLFDVYDAVTWSSLAPLSEESIRNGNAAVKVPRFTKSKSLTR